ncbi:unnamed protein product [Peronospora belbahrii]|uniref:Uncharacterized protein n=1 Tax=Peronospora belbahrii TaxID=622444 RepID=A0ABN8D8R7_9STRA|nr:unnamed protein product [Peronospora belbahrii]
MRDYASFYSERDTGGRRDLYHPGNDWKNPAVLLAVGIMQGTLDGVMLGLTVQTFEDARVRARRFNRLKWPLNMIVRPRDFTILSASGILTRANGERIGCIMVQLAQLPQLIELPKPMTRGKLIYGALFKEQQDRTVDVYIQIYVETMGHVLNTIVMNAMWVSMLGFWGASKLAAEKKLQWCILNRIKDPTNIRRRLEWNNFCGICKKLGRYGRGQSGRSSSNHTCAICDVSLCSNCRVKRSLKALTRRRKGSPTRNVQVVLYVPCLDIVSQTRATKVAWHQHQIRLMQSSIATTDRERSTWGLLDDADTPPLSPGHYFSITESSFSFLEGEDRNSMYVF